MKNLLSISTLLFIALVSICGQCTKYPLTTYRYTVKNESGHAIRVKSYMSRHLSYPPIITKLKVGEVLTKTHETRGESYSFRNFFGEEGNRARDSIVVIYAGKKYSSFTLGSAGPRNPLNVSYYRDEEETFIFTEEDYQRAEDCDNNC